MIYITFSKSHNPAIHKRRMIDFLCPTRQFFLTKIHNFTVSPNQYSHLFLIKNTTVGK